MIRLNPFRFLGEKKCSSICPKESTENSIQISAPELPSLRKQPTFQILVVLLIGWNFLSTNQKHYQGSGQRRVISMQFLRSLLRRRFARAEDLAKRRPFSQAKNSQAKMCNLSYLSRVTISLSTFLYKNCV